LICSGAAGHHAGLPAHTRARIGTVHGHFSGPPLLEGTLQRVRLLRRLFGPRPVLIGSGGIFHGRDALALIRAGADLIQIFTALVYRGPSAPGSIGRELAREMRRLGVRSLSAIRGMDI
jgi:dihydroorotate dehydrogenase